MILARAHPCQAVIPVRWPETDSGRAEVSAFLLCGAAEHSGTEGAFRGSRPIRMSVETFGELNYQNHQTKSARISERAKSK